MLRPHENDGNGGCHAGKGIGLPKAWFSVEGEGGVRGAGRVGGIGFFN